MVKRWGLSEDIDYCRESEQLIFPVIEMKDAAHIGVGRASVLRLLLCVVVFLLFAILGPSSRVRSRHTRPGSPDCCTARWKESLVITTFVF